MTSKVEDIFGNAVTVGDTVIVGLSSYHTPYLKKGEVIEIVTSGYKTRIKIKQYDNSTGMLDGRTTTVDASRDRIYRL